MTRLNATIERLRHVEQSLHVIWSSHCAGAPCKEQHKPVWIEIQATILDALTTLEVVERDHKKQR